MQFASRVLELEEARYGIDGFSKRIEHVVEFLVNNTKKRPESLYPAENVRISAQRRSSQR